LSGASVGIAVLVSLLVGGCGGGSGSSTAIKAESASSASLVNTPYQPNGTPVHGGVLRFARNGQPTSFTPWLGHGNEDIFEQMQIFDGLVESSPNPAKLTPGLAESWTISPDHLTYTFKLRPNVKFSNGEPLKATDVKWSLENAADPNVDENYAGLFEAIKTVTIPDPSTVKVTLSRVTPAFLSNLTISGALIMPQKVVEELGAKEFGMHPVGTGPFMVTQFAPGGTKVVMQKNPYYWKPGLPYLDGLEYLFIPEDNARMLAVESGSAEIGEAVPYSQLEQVENTPNVDVFKQHAFASDWMFINGFKEPFKDPTVRQALLYATPLNQISQTVFHGVAPVAATANMPTKYLNPNIKPYPYDTAKSRALLAKAGVENLEVTLTITSGDAVASQVATILQGAWAKAGIKLNIQQKDINSAIDDLINSNYELLNLPPNAQTSDVPVDDEFDEYMVHSFEKGTFTFVGWNEPKARKLVEEATRTWSDAKRRKLFYAYQEILAEQQPIIAFVFVPNLFAVRTNVHNFVAVGTVWPLMAEVWLSK
jgi:peptide/nickel transport system substrate-binding protein